VTSWSKLITWTLAPSTCWISRSRSRRRRFSWFIATVDERAGSERGAYEALGECTVNGEPLAAGTISLWLVVPRWLHA